MKKRAIIIISVIVVIVAAITITLVKNKRKLEKQNEVVDRSTIAVPVAVAEAQMQPVNRALILPATLQPVSEAVISVNAQGKLKTLNIELGTVVHKGQVLGTVDSRLKELNLQSTELTLDKLEKDYQRNEDLYKGNAISEVNKNDSKYNLDNTRIQADQLKQQINDGLVVSPINGVIVTKNLEAGEFVNPGTPIATVVNVTELKANVKVNESDAYRLKTGQAVSITCDLFPGKIFPGTVHYVSPKGDDSHNYEVEIHLKNSRDLSLKAGTYVRVDFQSESNGDALQVPKVALVEGLKNPYVYVINDNKAVVRKVEVGRELGENIEILGGLKPGEVVIISGQINLNEGSLVEVLKTK